MEEMLQWTKVQYNTIFDQRSSNLFFSGMCTDILMNAHVGLH